MLFILSGPALTRPRPLLATASSSVDLLVVPPGTAEADDLAAMDLAAQAASRIHAPDILAAVASQPAPARPKRSG